MKDNQEIRCQHLKEWTEVKQPKRMVCEACEKTGSSWLHLRTCQTCGTTLCCDSSPNKHASRHAAQTGHPVIISAEENERWAWCFPDQQFYEY